MLSCLVLLACSKTGKIREDTIVKNRIRIEGDSLTQAYAEKEKKDFVRSLYPPATGLPLKAIITRTLHQDEASKDMENMKWYGLFKSQSGYYVSSAVLVMRPAYDPMVDLREDDESTWTGWDVSTINIDEAIILISRDANLKSGDVKYDPKLQGIVIRPGGSIDFEFNSIKYKLYAEGEVINAEWDPQEKVIHNYRLYLEAEMVGEKKTQLLAATPFLDDAEFEIMFVGDIDSDGIVDLVINTHHHYNIYRPTVYLSSFAGRQEITRPVALHESVAY
ncbi:MAG TPA: hypothetical protein DIT04_05025 [Dysgonomonas sp.]|nr:hypothetical protein [Dysgonomonas sp.]